MTVGTNKPVSGPYPSNGVKKDWPFEFKIRDISHMSLVINNDDGSGSQTVTTGFSIDDIYINNDGGGYVIYPVSGPALPAGKSVFAIRVVPYSQPTRIGNQGNFWPQTHEDTFDLLAMQVQQIAEEQSRSLSVGVGVEPPNIDSIFQAETNAAAYAAAANASKIASAASELNAANSAAAALASKNAAGVSEVNAANANISASAYASEAFGYRNTAVAAAASADADAAQTAADRVQTGLDRVQTGLDRVQTGLDRTAAAASAAAAATWDPSLYVPKTGVTTIAGSLTMDVLFVANTVEGAWVATQFRTAGSSDFVNVGKRNDNHHGYIQVGNTHRWEFSTAAQLVLPAGGLINGDGNVFIASMGWISDIMFRTAKMRMAGAAWADIRGTDGIRDSNLGGSVTVVGLTTNAVSGDNRSVVAMFYRQLQQTNTAGNWFTIPSL